VTRGILRNCRQIYKGIKSRKIKEGRKEIKKERMKERKKERR
jgi:hypothetical protein